MAYLRVELDVVTENRVYDHIEDNECAPEKLTIMKFKTHVVGRHGNRDRARVRRGSRSSE